jgi:Mg/Co/Ni transporter MgtE
MSARAASRLERLGFTPVYRYQAGKADWLAAGLPREGTEAHIPRVADVAVRDVPTCRIDERVGAVRDRVQAGRWDVCVVVDQHGVVLGLVPGDVLDRDPGTPVEQVMHPGPVTVRPHLRAGQTPDYLRTPRTPRALVTTSDGILVGLLRLQDVEGQQTPLTD